MLHSVVLVHDGDLIAALQFGDGLLRNKQCAMQGFDGNPHLAVLSGRRMLPGFGNRPVTSIAPVPWLVDLPTGEGKLSLMRMNGSVGKNQFQRRYRIGRFALFRKPEIFLFADCESDLDRVNVETVVTALDTGLTRLPIWVCAVPAMPSMGNTIS
jgi:hypothetical protein